MEGKESVDVGGRVQPRHVNTVGNYTGSQWAWPAGQSLSLQGVGGEAGRGYLAHSTGIPMVAGGVTRFRTGLPPGRPCQLRVDSVHGVSKPGELRCSNQSSETAQRWRCLSFPRLLPSPHLPPVGLNGMLGLRRLGHVITP